MDNWKEFVFNEPYVGGKIERINNVILPKQYVGFMKKHNGGKGDIGTKKRKNEKRFSVFYLVRCASSFCSRNSSSMAGGKSGSL